MIPVRQRGDDCWAACVASILELPLDQVPPFSPEIDWEPAWQRFLLERNLYQLTSQFDATAHSVPPGYSILLCRTTCKDLQGYDWQNHCLVCCNGWPVWDPNGYRIPRDWDGIIRSRDWQIVDPLGWIVFISLDPAKALGNSPLSLTAEYAAMIDTSVQLLQQVRWRSPQYRKGADFGFFSRHQAQIVAAYTDAMTDADGEASVIATLRELKQKHLNVLHGEEDGQ